MSQTMTEGLDEVQREAAAAPVAPAASAAPAANAPAASAAAPTAPTPAAPTALLRARGVTVRYDHVKEALHPTTLGFDAGQVTALIGPSGCGKSTFLRCLNLMNREISKCDVGGEILYHGRNINTREENLFQLRTSIGMVFQQPTPFRKSIRENILFAPRRAATAASPAARRATSSSSVRFARRPSGTRSETSSTEAA